APLIGVAAAAEKHAAEVTIERRQPVLLELHLEESAKTLARLHMLAALPQAAGVLVTRGVTQPGNVDEAEPGIDEQAMLVRVVAGDVAVIRVEVLPAGRAEHVVAEVTLVLAVQGGAEDLRRLARVVLRERRGEQGVGLIEAQVFAPLVFELQRRARMLRFPIG